MVLPYETIFSRARGRINDPKELSLSAGDLTEIYTERLHNVIGNPRVLRLFSSIDLDDEIQRMEFALRNSENDFSDKEFVCNLLILGMTIEWLQPQVDAVIYTAAFIGSTQEKKILDGHSEMIDRLKTMKTEFNRIICDRGYVQNSYISGGT